MEGKVAVANPHPPQSDPRTPYTYPALKTRGEFQPLIINCVRGGAEVTEGGWRRLEVQTPDKLLVTVNVRLRF